MIDRIIEEVKNVLIEKDSVVQNSVSLDDTIRKCWIILYMIQY